MACEDTKESPNSAATQSPRIRKKSKLLSPANNLKLAIGDEIAFEVTLRDENVTIDSIELEGLGETLTFNSSKFNWTPLRPRTGKPRIKLSIYFEGNKETLYPKPLFVAKSEPKKYTYRVIHEYPHDESAFTQGLFFKEDTLYESTGRRRESTIRKVDIETGKVLQKKDLQPSFFGEGCVLYDNKVFQLTWTSQTAFVYDLNFNELTQFSYPTEGWGLTSHKNQLVLSDGSEKLYLLNPDNFSQLDQLEVYDNEKKIEHLNELENVKGKIYANVYGEEYIVVIDPESGSCRGRDRLFGHHTSKQRKSRVGPCT